MFGVRRYWAYEIQCWVAMVACVFGSLYCLMRFFDLREQNGMRFTAHQNVWLQDQAFFEGMGIYPVADNMTSTMAWTLVCSGTAFVAAMLCLLALVSIRKAG